VIKQIKIDIEISDFFELTHFDFDGKEDDNVQLNSKFSKVLLSGELEEEMMGIFPNGGIYLISKHQLKN
jgi:hypothetical protein